MQSIYLSDEKNFKNTCSVAQSISNVLKAVDTNMRSIDVDHQCKTNTPKLFSLEYTQIRGSILTPTTNLYKYIQKYIIDTAWK